MYSLLSNFTRSKHPRVHPEKLSHVTKKCVPEEKDDPCAKIYMKCKESNAYEQFSKSLKYLPTDD